MVKLFVTKLKQARDESLMKKKAGETLIELALSNKNLTISRNKSVTFMKISGMENTPIRPGRLE